MSNAHYLTLNKTCVTVTFTFIIDNRLYFICGVNHEHLYLLLKFEKSGDK